LVERSIVIPFIAPAKGGLTHLPQNLANNTRPRLANISFESVSRTQQYCQFALTNRTRSQHDSWFNSARFRVPRPITPLRLRQLSLNGRTEQRAPEPLKRTPSKFLKHASTHPSIIILTSSQAAHAFVFIYFTCASERKNIFFNCVSYIF
jgi:hypothetical protein